MFNAIIFNSLLYSDSEALRVFAYHQYLQKRSIATEIGSSFNEILEQFKDCKSSEEKKRIASDMANDTIGNSLFVFN